MFPIAGQTAGPNGLMYFVDTPWVAGGVLGQKKLEIYFLTFFSILSASRS